VNWVRRHEPRASDDSPSSRAPGAAGAARSVAEGTASVADEHGSGADGLPAQTGSRERRRRWLMRAAVVVLLAFYVALTTLASNQKGLSYDEGEHIAIGYNQWTRHDFRMESANGDLVKRWATLPLLISKPALPATDNHWWRRGEPYNVAYEFFFFEGNNPRALLWQCRAMITLAGVATALLVFSCARRLFGEVGALISLTLFVSSPSMLAFGGMVTTEMTTGLALLASVASSWRLLQRVTWGRLLTSLGVTALLVLAKPTAVLMLPITGILIALRLAFGGPLEWRVAVVRVVRSRRVQVAGFALLFVVHAAMGWATIWAAYDFRFAASPALDDQTITMRSQPEDPIDPTVISALHWSNRHHFLPEGFTRGIRWVLAQNESLVAFMDGEWKVGGWRTFFPYAAWAKTAPPLLLALAVACVGIVLSLRRKRFADPPAVGLLRAVVATARDQDAVRDSKVLYHSAPFVVLILVYFGAALFWNMNIGFRHILPMYPAAYVLAGGCVLLLTTGWFSRLALSGVLAWSLGIAVQIYPDFLAYFSPVVGGSSAGYRRLVDSSLDWGTDLPGLKRWLDAHNTANPEPVYLAYFGVDNPDYYGIDALRLPGRPDWIARPEFPLGPGLYAISATLFQGIGTPTVGRWNGVFEQAYWQSLVNVQTYDRTATDPKARAALLATRPKAAWDADYARFDRLRFGRLCAWLRQRRPPDAQVGYSILIWKLSKDDIAAAGLGPPAEMAEKPLLAIY
jgi:4-amino-4-deoxy-L-arabinose transferase-like glycosyltransferase